jgi:hypothetical protein
LILGTSGKNAIESPVVWMKRDERFLSPGGAAVNSQGREPLGRRREWAKPRRGRKWPDASTFALSGYAVKDFRRKTGVCSKARI